jgi:radical SAM superfamily enzyme YgiQ (UPF0313 family)
MTHYSRYKINLIAINPEGYSLSLGYLHAALIKNKELQNKLDVRSFVYDVDEIGNPSYDFTNLLIEILENNPEIIVILVYSWNFELTKRIVEIVNHIRPQIKIILGGPQFYKANFLKDFSNFSSEIIVILGEAEDTLPTIVKSLIFGESIIDIQGIAFKNKEKWIINPRNSPADLTKIPSPIQEKTLIYDPEKLFLYSTSRGCLYRCAYCLYHCSDCLWNDGFGLRYFPLEVVKKDLEIIRKAGVKRIWFTDSIFGADEERYCKILDWLIEWDNNCKFAFETRAEFLTPKLISRFAKINIEWIALGIQSLTCKALQSVNRGCNTEKVIKRIDELRKALKNPEVIHLDLIFGLPGDSLEGTCRTIDWLYNRFPDVTFYFGVLRVLPGTKVWEQALKENWYINSSCQFYELIENKDFNFQDIITLKNIGLGLDFLQLESSRSWVREILNKTDMKYSDLCLMVGKYLRNKGYGKYHESYRYGQFDKIIGNNIKIIYKDLEKLIFTKGEKHESIN